MSAIPYENNYLNQMISMFTAKVEEHLGDGVLEAQVEKLFEEADEVEQSGADITELADCIIVCLVLGALQGYEVEQVLMAAEEKMETNLVRNWDVTDEGLLHHVV